MRSCWSRRCRSTPRSPPGRSSGSRRCRCARPREISQRPLPPARHAALGQVSATPGSTRTTAPISTNSLLVVALGGGDPHAGRRDGGALLRALPLPREPAALLHHLQHDHLPAADHDHRPVPDPGPVRPVQQPGRADAGLRRVPAADHDLHPRELLRAHPEDLFEAARIDGYSDWSDLLADLAADRAAGARRRPSSSTSSCCGTSSSMRSS